MLTLPTVYTKRTFYTSLWRRLAERKNDAAFLPVISLLQKVMDWIWSGAKIVLAKPSPRLQARTFRLSNPYEHVLFVQP
jgi:hypothetical protein